MNRLRLFSSIVLVSLLSLYLLQCSSNNSDSGGENTIVNPPVNSGLVGTWQSVNFAIVSATDTSVTVDLSVYGVNLTMNLNSDSTYSSATTFQGQDITESGIYSVHGNQLTFYPDNSDPRTSEYVLDENHLTITTMDEEFDFNQDGVMEPAVITVELEKMN